MASLTIEQIREVITGSFQVDKSTGIEGIAQFSLRDAVDQSWALQIKDQQVSVEQGTDPNAAVTISMTSQDCIQLFEGKLDPAKAFMQGRIKLTGNLAFAMKLISLFNLGQS
ncbi:MAG TPA: SCP2 sterol-binding domain-containing protein [Anaerolineaceae bacterium]|nr:SCP2 sterol-binding domain-containing protein [Anaerolineaceae bacterium]